MRPAGAFPEVIAFIPEASQGTSFLLLGSSIYSLSLSPQQTSSVLPLPLVAAGRKLPPFFTFSLSP
jgi:hypothetical protein